MSAPFELTPGLTWDEGTVRCSFIRISNSGGVLTGLIKRGEEYDEVPLVELASEIVQHVFATRPDLQERADDDWMIARLPSDAHQEMRRRLAAVLEVTTGLRAGGAPRPEYDLATTKPVQRRRLKAKEEGVDDKTIKRWIKAYEKDGDAGLVHGNRHMGTALDLHSPDVVRIAREVAEEEVTRSGKTQQNLVVILNQRLRAAGFDQLSIHRGDKLLAEVSRGMSLRGTTKSSRSKKSRPPGGRGHIKPTLANEIWELDSNYLDCLAYSPLSKTGVPAYVICIIDTCTRILSAYVTLNPPSATAVALAIHRRINPFLLSRSMLPIGPAIPEAIAIDEDSVLVHPGGAPGEVHTDNGPEYQNELVHSLLTTLGIDIVFSRPRTGSDKPHIESVIGTVNHTVTQLVPGYKGRSPDHRGEHPHKDPLPTLDQLQAILDGYCLAHNNTPHTGLPHPAQLGTFQTPMDAYTASITGGAPLRLSADINLLYRYMPTKTAVVSGRGPTIDGIVYTSDDTAVMRRLSAGDAHVAGRPLAFHHDPGDRTHVHWHEPGTARWHILTAHGRDGTAIPALSDEFYNRALDLPAKRRPNKQDRVDAAMVIADYVAEVLITVPGARVLKREFNRWQEGLTRFARTGSQPLPTAPRAARTGTRRSSTSSATPTNASPPLPDAFDLNLDAYVEEMDDIEGVSL